MAKKLCKKVGVLALSPSIKKSQGLFFWVFFTAKTHKDGTPFGVIVSEHETWQKCLGFFLQRSLGILNTEYPFLVRCPAKIF